MATQHWEVEVKFPLSDPAEVCARLAALGLHFGPAVEQVDHYFNHPARDFAATDEALRLRQVGVENCVTYKGPKIDKSTKTREEIELSLPAGRQVADDFAALFRVLGFCPAGTVRKERQRGTLSGDGHLVEVALDNIQVIGCFLELEISANDESLESAKKALESLAQELGLGRTERRSYLELIKSRTS